MAGVDRSWQAGPDFNTAVKQFHDRLVVAFLNVTLNVLQKNRTQFSAP